MTAYLGLLKLTHDRISLQPEPPAAAIRVRVLADFISQTARGSPWHIVGLPPRPNPAEMLRLVLCGVFEKVLQESADGEVRSLASAALAEGPYTGALYAVGITPIPGSPHNFRLCDYRLLTVRNGQTWRDLRGRPLTNGERDRAVRFALDEIQAGHQKTLRQGRGRR